MKKLFAIMAILMAVCMFSGTALAGNTASAEANAGAIINMPEDSREFKDMPRPFANGTEITYPGMPNFFGPDKQNANTMDLQVILEMKKTWTRECLKETGTKAKTNTRARFFEPRRHRLGNEFKAKDTDTIDIHLGMPPKDARLAGVVVVRARDTKTTTLEVLADAGRHALDIPGATLYVVAYNSSKVVQSSGWGIGFHTSAATANGTNDLSTITSGGTGYSTGEAGFGDKPWIHAYVVVLP